LILGWLQAYSTHRRSARLLKLILLPAWLGMGGALNAAGLLGDALDPTRSFYSNVMIVASRQ
jgi:hypothetical protein